MNNIDNWKRAISLVQRMIDDKIEIYEVMKIFTPMATPARRNLLYCNPGISSSDLDQVEKAIERYKSTLEEMGKTEVEVRIKRSTYFQKLKEHYDKDKDKK
jgi:hypothetical protein